jgi:hypothetical protein
VSVAEAAVTVAALVAAVAYTAYLLWCAFRAHLGR